MASLLFMDWETRFSGIGYVIAPSPTLLPLRVVGRFAECRFTRVGMLGRHSGDTVRLQGDSSRARTEVVVVRW